MSDNKTLDAAMASTMVVAEAGSRTKLTGKAEVERLVVDKRNRAGEIVTACSDSGSGGWYVLVTDPKPCDVYGFTAWGYDLGGPEPQVDTERGFVHPKAQVCGARPAGITEWPS